MRGFNDHFNAPGLDFTATDDRDGESKQFEGVSILTSSCTLSYFLEGHISEYRRFLACG